MVIENIFALVTVIVIVAKVIGNSILFYIAKYQNKKNKIPSHKKLYVLRKLISRAEVIVIVIGDQVIVIVINAKYSNSNRTKLKSNSNRSLVIPHVIIQIHVYFIMTNLTQYSAILLSHPRQAHTLVQTSGKCWRQSLMYRLPVRQPQCPPPPTNSFDQIR